MKKVSEREVVYNWILLMIGAACLSGLFMPHGFVAGAQASIFFDVLLSVVMLVFAFATNRTNKHSVEGMPKAVYYVLMVLVAGAVAFGLYMVAGLSTFNEYNASKSIFETTTHIQDSLNAIVVCSAILVALTTYIAGLVTRVIEK